MMTPDALAALLQSRTGHALLDVRERAAFERGHVYRATSLPRRLLETRLPRLVSALGTPIVLYDDAGAIAPLAAATLAAMGYRDVQVLAGGLTAWRASGKRVVQGLNVPSKVFGEQALHRYHTPELTCPELKAKIDAGERMLLVDSRTPEEYSRGCIPGAWSVPGAELVLRIADLAPTPDIPIVVHCGGRTRSIIGAESLRRMGLPNPIIALKNGTMGWQLAGYEPERGAARWAPPVSARSRAVGEAAAERVAKDDGIQFIDPAGVQAALARRAEQNVAFLDVRTAEEYAAGHPAGSVWAPGGQVIQATDEYVGVRDATIVLTCDGFVRAVMTASWLSRMGFPSVRVLRGGLEAWKAAGGAVETGPGAPVPFGYEAARARAQTVTPRALQAELGGGAAPLVIDVDESDAYAAGHVPGALWLCRSRLELTAPGAVAGRAVVVTCADGVMSTLSVAALEAAGAGSVRVLAGGKRAWAEAGLAGETGATKLGDEADDVVLKPYQRGRDAMLAYLRWEEDLDAEGVSPHALLPGVPKP
ncbi:MAG: sulfurtransferase [Candidatus Rokubacteria bacterium]|nr:sulfurtransferase [Candidatus Rokubacteria bacterium]